jgi:hypothetical protein
MIRKPIHILALFLGLLVCSLEGQFEVGPIVQTKVKEN